MKQEIMPERAESLDFWKEEFYIIQALEFNQLDWCKTQEYYKTRIKFSTSQIIAMNKKASDKNISKFYGGGP